MLDTHLSREFSEQIEVMRIRRKHDSQLNGICSDFEEIAMEISDLESRDQVSSKDEIADLKNTLFALRKEIMEILSQPQN